MRSPTSTRWRARSVSPGRQKRCSPTWWTPTKWCAGWARTPNLIHVRAACMRWTSMPSRVLEAGTSRSCATRIVFTFGWKRDGDVPPGSSTVEVTLSGRRWHSCAPGAPRSADGRHARPTSRRLATVSGAPQSSGTAVANQDPIRMPIHLRRSVVDDDSISDKQSSGVRRRIVRDARQVLDGTMADVTETQVHFIPPGVANPLGRPTPTSCARRT